LKTWGLELAACQRYYYRLTNTVANNPFAIGVMTSTTNCTIAVPFPVKMRDIPTALEASAASTFSVRTGGGSPATVVAHSASTSESYGGVDITVSPALTAGDAGIVRAATVPAYMGWSADL
jgi:hypothetical protein